MDDRLQPLVRLCRAAPVRTALLSVVPLVLAVAQLLNSYYFGVPFAIAAAFSAVLVGFAVLVTRYHLASDRRRRLTATAYERGAD